MKNQNGFGNFGANLSFGSVQVSPETNQQVFLNAKTALEVLALVNRPAAMQLVAEVNFALNGPQTYYNPTAQYQQPQYGGMNVPPMYAHNAQSNGRGKAAMSGWDRNTEFQQAPRATGQNSFTRDSSENPTFLDVTPYGYGTGDFIECRVLLRYPTDVLVETVGVAFFDHFSVAFLVQTQRSPHMVVVPIDSLFCKDGRITVRAKDALPGYSANGERSVIDVLRSLGYNEAADLFENNQKPNNTPRIDVASIISAGNWSAYPVEAQVNKINGSFIVAYRVQTETVGWNLKGTNAEFLTANGDVHPVSIAELIAELESSSLLANELAAVQARLAENK